MRANELHLAIAVHMKAMQDCNPVSLEYMDRAIVHHHYEATMPG